MLEELNIQNCSVEFLLELKKQLKAYKKGLIQEVEFLEIKNKEIQCKINDNIQKLEDTDYNCDDYWDICDEGECLEDNMRENKNRIYKNSLTIDDVDKKIFEIEDEIYFKNK